jgi:hypothetical protein
MASEPGLLADEDRALLVRVASRVVELRLEVPAIMALETVAPVSLLAGQAMVFFEPVVSVLLRLRDYRRFARLVERRDALETLGRLIETRAAETRSARRSRTGGGRPDRGRGGDARA